jgi:hypothetical protein
VNPANRTIVDLDILVEALSPKSKRLFHRIFSLNTVKGHLKPPESMLSWIEQQFGSVDRVTEQKIIKLTNLVTFEGSIFNTLRALRPRQYEDRLKVEAKLMDRAKDDPLNKPLEDTPEDIFGRIKGKHCITASNIAKYDGLHGMIIFKNYNPLKFSREETIDYLDTGWKWAQKAHKFDPSAKYYFFLWNSLKKAGASLAHGHAQVVLSREHHYAKIEALRQAALHYKAENGSDYFDDLYQIHLDLGLALEKNGIRVLTYLTPIKEKETMLISPGLNRSFKERLYEVLACFRDCINVTAFNVGIAVPPLNSLPEGWKDFPVIARIVDRGYPWDGSSDFGTMELYAASIISSDPFQVAEELKEALNSTKETRRR